MLPRLARPLFLSFHHHQHRPVATSIARMDDAPADYETPAPTGGRGRGRGRGFRGRGRGRRGRGRGRGAAAGAGEGDALYEELETTATIVEIPLEEEVEVDAVEESQGDGGRGGRGRGRGRGWRRGRRPGRGRGRGAAPAEARIDAEAGEGEQAEGASEARAPRPWRERPPRQPRLQLTHFISLPIGHHAELQKTISSLTDGLLAADPAIAGLDPTIVVPARRLHLTLGVMSLKKEVSAEQSEAAPASDGAEQSPAVDKPTLASAIAHLESLKPQIMQLLEGKKLQVELSRIDIMRFRANIKRANVMWVGPPEEGELAERLRVVAVFVNESFMEAGFLAEERELKLHCTVLNSIYRKPRHQYKGRIPFSFASILKSDAFRTIALEPDTLAVLVDEPGGGGSTELVSTEVDAAEPSVANGDGGGKGKGKAQGGGGRKWEPVPVSLGVWDVDEIQICEMGSHGPEGEYLAVGKIVLD
ncbi:uncharacterized protein C8Q71DRAFT_782775 [Rhodofomes roseus]|uniref:A-kinase anchor protein 7-like phosphoesterase domain-containing protein n=1 Tax=Rhodofomes roseus TaxID=34475 RepID=A0ABQ8K3M0_9APHY|nr:uncharacterized protein C8Q71DRAFT_782775 [Rhodofomes roseus]KAH9831484.1 hypothetical protein C8Q71DRAFT_782775 [Rhodofomes roseus]